MFRNLLSLTMFNKRQIFKTVGDEFRGLDKREMRANAKHHPSEKKAIWLSTLSEQEAEDLARHNFGM